MPNKCQTWAKATQDPQNEEKIRSGKSALYQMFLAVYEDTREGNGQPPEPGAAYMVEFSQVAQ